jgi:hypothetical protein
VSVAGLFAVMVHERPPPKLDDLPDMVVGWLRDAGGFAAVGLALWLTAFAIQVLAHALSRSRGSSQEPRPGWKQFLSLLSPEEQWPAWKQLTFIALASGAGLSYLVFFLTWAIGKMGSEPPAGLADGALTIGGACALGALGLPFVTALLLLRPRRIWGLAWSLTFREAVRNKVYFVFGFLVLVFLFAQWFMPQKPENQLRTHVQVLYLAMALLVLLTGVILAAFAIPNDLRHQTMHTVVTKPVERFEIVLGRFLGYTMLLSVALLAMTLVSLMYISRGIHPDAERESWRARVPVYGELKFVGLPKAEGVNIGREWDYRRYIPGGPGTPARAVWVFHELPGLLDERTVVPCEFSFDIFRMTRGEENRGVKCTIMFQTWRWNPARMIEYDKEAGPPTATRQPEISNRLAEKYGYFEIPGHEVFNNHTYTLDVPAGLFKNAQPSAQELEQLGSKPPLVQVSVRCENFRQFLGMAKHDLYLVDAEGFGGFAGNFFRGALGLWFRLCLIVGVAVACSTYLNGVVSLMCALFLYGLGLAREFISGLAMGTAYGGGPFEAAYRFVQRMNVTTPLDATPATQTATVFDEGFRWFLKRLLNLIPDVDRFDLSRYVSEGFAITNGSLFLCALQLAGYLLPWAVLAFYLMKSREVAS